MNCVVSVWTRHLPGEAGVQWDLGGWGGGGGGGVDFNMNKQVLPIGPSTLAVCSMLLPSPRYLAYVLSWHNSYSVNPI